jgi:ABC-2 type transport system ATP-binding protein
MVSQDQAVIETRGLTKHYGRTMGLEDLDLSVERGEVFGFLGPNGAGKTTTIRLLLDLIRPTRGEARLLGRAVGDPALRARVGYLPGELGLDSRMSGRGMLELLGELQPGGAPPSLPRRRDELCERLGLSSTDLERRVRDYSRGMKQKVGLVSALQHEPELLVLDEPTTGLDPLVREAVFELLAEARAAGRTVFHSSHILGEVDRTCDRVAIVRDGRLLTLGRVEEIRRSTVRRMVVRFAGAVPREELDLPGAELLEAEEGRAVLRVTGDPNALLRVLARHRIEDLVFPEPSLEETFLHLYRGRQGDEP